MSTPLTCFLGRQAAAEGELAHCGRLREVRGGLEWWYKRDRERWVYTHTDIIVKSVCTDEFLNLFRKKKEIERSIDSHLNTQRDQY